MAEPLEIKSLEIFETRYPFNTPECESPLEKLCRRTWQVCAHETYMDCPYYEQLMYIGDSWIQILLTYVMSKDYRLVKQSILTLFESQTPTGVTMSRFPSNSEQIIPPFSLVLIAMLRDYSDWSHDEITVKQQMPKIRSILDFFFKNMHDGILKNPEGWNFCDWIKAPGWEHGTAPNLNGVTCWLNLLLLYNIRNAAALEVGDAAAKLNDKAKQLSLKINETFRSDKYGMLSDLPSEESFSEHVQALSILCDIATEWPDVSVPLTNTTVFFKFYTFLALKKLGRTDLIEKRLTPWRNMLDAGLNTTMEEPEPSRSDCHAWSAHPLYFIKKLKY